MKHRSNDERARQWRAIEAEAAALRERGVLMFSPGEAIGLGEAGVNIKAMRGAGAMVRCETIQREYERRSAAERKQAYRSVAR